MPWLASARAPKRVCPRPRVAVMLVGPIAAILLATACTSQTVAVDDSGAPTAQSGRPTTITPAPAPFSGVQVASTIGGFDTPWDLRFLPDGTPLVTERPGRIVTVLDGRRQVVSAIPDVFAQGEGGLMGLALDPDFEANRLIYTCYAAGSSGSVSDVRVVRFRLSENLASLTDMTPLVTDIPAGVGNRHLGCRLEVGPDGMLWITTGDAVQPRAPQDPGNRAGKVLRATLTGDPAPGNPGGSWDPYVYTVGHRNPQGLAFRAADGAAFAVEHGTSCDDEINELAAGGNYGWNPVGPGGSYAEDAPMTSPEVEEAAGAVWSSGCPTIAPSGAEFIVGEQWGRLAGQLAVAVLKDQRLLMLEVDGRTVGGTTSGLGGTLGRLRTVRNAPDGRLWIVVDASPGTLVRVQPRS